MSAMPTNNPRPFMSNFLAAFRAHSALSKAAATSSPASTTASAQTPYNAASPNSASTSTSGNASSSPRTITTKAGAQSSGPTTSAVQATTQFQPTRQHSASPYSRSPGSPGSPGFPLQTSSRGRRGSDSSSEGYRETMGADKWYIGGRTAAGEERFYKLSMAKRPRSIDRLSL